jgi:hypothetical protein
VTNWTGLFAQYARAREVIPGQRRPETCDAEFPDGDARWLAAVASRPPVLPQVYYLTKEAVKLGISISSVWHHWRATLETMPIGSFDGSAVTPRS